MNRNYDIQQRFIDVVSDLTTDELKGFLAMGVIYLQKEKQIDFKTIIKHFRKCNKEVGL